MHYKVFLDTNIYDGVNYAFRNGLFSQLKEYAQAGNLELQINSVVKGEVQKHIRKRIDEVVCKLNKIINAPEFASFRIIPEYSIHVETIDKENWIDKALSELDSLLHECRVEDISSNNICIEKIISDYFDLRYPFEQAKKDEFPDAITVQSIAREIEELSEGRCFPDYNNDDLLYCVVSADKGFNQALETEIGERPNEDVKYFESLNELISFIAIQDDNAAELQRRIRDGYLKEFIETTVEEGLECADFIVNDPEGCVEDVYKRGTGDYQCDAYVLGLQIMSDGTKVARIYIDATFDVMLEYSYLNEDESYWDKEDRKYWWEVITDVLANFRTSTSIIFTVVISPDGEVEFNDYIELPSTIEVNEDDLIEIVSKESRDRR